MHLITCLLVLAFVACIYKGLKSNHQIVFLGIFKKTAIYSLLIFFCLMLWTVFFYFLCDFSLTKINPIYLLYLACHTNELDFLTATKLWAFPACFFIMVAANYIAPMLEPSSRSIYGKAHWATRREVKKLGFLNQKGNLIVGDMGGQLLQYKLTNHALVFAPSRSGKGVSLVIPNALNWQGSLLATDNKYEIFEYTSQYRKQGGNEVYRFSPANDDFKTHCINPLDYIDRVNPSKKITDIHLILDILIRNSEGENQMWAEEARSIALGVLLWLMQSDRPFTMGEFASIIKGGAEFESFLQEILDAHTIADNLITLDSAAYLAIQNFLQKAPKEQSGVRSTLTSMVRLWEDPFICAATAKSDFDFRDMRKRPISLYLSFGTNQIHRLAPLINLIVQLFLNVMLKNLPKEDEPEKVLCLLDEINRFGKMETLRDGFGDLAGYGVHLMPIIQNVGQFYSTYNGRDGTDIFFQNTDIKVVFRQNADTDKEFVSKTLGSKTVRLKTRSYQTGKSGSSYNESFVERPLLTPQEVGRFSQKHQIVVTGDATIKCKKIIYYKDKRFKHKILSPINIPVQIPQYPIIDIKKSNEQSPDNEKKHLDVRNQGNYKPVDSHTQTYFNDLASEFE